MRYILTVIHATYNTGSVTDEFTFDDFYDMADYIEGNFEQWQAYYITDVEG